MIHFTVRSRLIYGTAWLWNVSDEKFEDAHPSRFSPNWLGWASSNFSFFKDQWLFVHFGSSEQSPFLISSNFSSNLFRYGKDYLVSGRGNSSLTWLLLKRPFYFLNQHRSVRAYWYCNGHFRSTQIVDRCSPLFPTDLQYRWTVDLISVYRNTYT